MYNLYLIIILCFPSKNNEKVHKSTSKVSNVWKRSEKFIYISYILFSEVSMQRVSTCENESLYYVFSITCTITRPCL